MMMDFRIGFGVDVHQLVADLPLVIGGVSVPSLFGALGHSDADVLIHAICDALLGAANLRDIGHHFSDKDPMYKGIDSAILLRKTIQLIAQKKYTIVNLDCTVILETPKLSPYIEEMQNKLSSVIGLDADCISIKATTHEKMDSFGEGKAIKAYAICMLQKKKDETTLEN
jgi:2-C-methyl-D-erythritol 2,4-cyclodiphosphate synthase